MKLTNVIAKNIAIQIHQRLENTVIMYEVLRIIAGTLIELSQKIIMYWLEFQKTITYAKRMAMHMNIRLWLSKNWVGDCWMARQ